MIPATEKAAIPLAIRVLSQSRRLEIDWDDGRVTALTHWQLRTGCRCAHCSAQRCRGIDVGASAEVELIRIAACGAGAVQLTFSDGHSRGIYPFSYLQSLAA